MRGELAGHGGRLWNYFALTDVTDVPGWSDGSRGGGFSKAREFAADGDQKRQIKSDDEIIVA